MYLDSGRIVFTKVRKKQSQTDTSNLAEKIPELWVLFLHSQQIGRSLSCYAVREKIGSRGQSDSGFQHDNNRESRLGL